jgi:HemK-like putative methylase
MLSIPSLSIEAPIQFIDKADEKTFQAALKNGVVHYPGTALAGEFGNMYIFGHSSDYIWSKGHYKTIFAVLPIKTWTITPLDTEIVAAVFLRDTQSLPQSLIDIGTGSGCIAVTLAAELPGLTIVASDMDAGALSLAAENARKHGVASRIHFVQADGAAVLQNATEPFFVVSNPPYIPDDAFVDADVLREPRQALFGGPDGADLVRALASAALTHPLCAGIAIECRREQVEKLAVQDS